MRESIVQLAQPVPRRRAGRLPERAARRIGVFVYEQPRSGARVSAIGRCREARAGGERDLVVARGDAGSIAMVSNVAVALATACTRHRVALREKTDRSRAPQTRPRERMTRQAPGWLFQMHFKRRRALNAACCESAHQPRDLQRSHRFMRNTIGFTECSKQSDEW
jgi:hypothetical protein